MIQMQSINLNKKNSAILLISTGYIMFELYEPEPRATPSYRHSRIVLVNQYVNAYSWES